MNLKQVSVCMLAAGFSLSSTGCWRSSPPGSLAQGDKEYPRFRARTDLGVPLPWPDGFDPRGLRIPQGLEPYSPDGRYLAFESSDVHLGVLDLQTRELRTWPEDFGAEPDHGCGAAFWVSNDSLLVRESWQTPEQKGKLEQSPPIVQFEHALRIVRIPHGSTVFYREAGAAPGTCGPVGRLAGGRLLGMDGGDWVGEYDLEHAALLNPMHVEVPATGISVMYSPWLITLDGVLPPDPGVPQGAPVELEYVNFDTGAVTRIADFPNVAAWRRIFITADGRWVFSGYYDQQRQGPVPVVVDSQTAQRIDLPQEESWLPVGLSEARGVLLVVVQNQLSEDHWERAFYEILLDALLIE